MNTRMQSDGTRVPEVIGSLSEFDILAIRQYSDHWRGTSSLQPEKSLMLAVLLDAVESFQEYVLLRDEHANRRFRETEDWIVRNDHKWLFSFRNICDALEIDPQYLRKSLLHWKKHAMQSASTRQQNKRSA
jgi:hypothetical protein